MGCPACGNKAARLIAPGFYRCEADVLVGVTSEQVPAYAPCGQEFQDGPSGTAALCWCMTAAVRFCRVCRRGLCGDHAVQHTNSADTYTTWHCSSCRSNDLQRVEQDRQRWRVSRAADYRTLPAVDADLLKSWIAGAADLEAFVDGTTHQAWGWTARQIADLIAELLGISRFEYVIASDPEVRDEGYYCRRIDEARRKGGGFAETVARDDYGKFLRRELHRRQEAQARRDRGLPAIAAPPPGPAIGAVPLYLLSSGTVVQRRTENVACGFDGDTPMWSPPTSRTISTEVLASDGRLNSIGGQSYPGCDVNTKLFACIRATYNTNRATAATSRPTVTAEPRQRRRWWSLR